MTVIYFIQVEKQDIFKVGITRGYDELPKRLSTLQTGNHQRLLVYGFARVDWMSQREIEKKLHDYLYDKRIRGEWFAISREEVEEIAKLFKLDFRYYWQEFAGGYIEDVG
jgi:hypothetical protein